MSQSPTDRKVQSPDETYLNAWQDLAKKIREGSSFSGRERNCGFLNLGDRRFADASSVLGLDQIDDSRSVAITDWDQDGDLDVLLSNRTGPRLRFLQNTLSHDGPSISITLIGDVAQRTNRDAIGAKLLAEIKNENGEKRTVIRSLYAGDGFLSQSTKSIHIGLQTGETLSSLKVRWPGSTSFQTITNVPGGGRFSVQQSTGIATRLASRPPTKIPDSRLEPHPPTNEVAVSLSTPSDVKLLSYQTLENQKQAIDFKSSRTTWIVLWATWCSPCLGELNAISSESKTLKQKGIDVLALSVESLDDDPSSTTAKELVTAWQQQNKFPFSVGMATLDVVQELDRVRRDALYGYQQMPIPSSFLVDQNGRVFAFYTGPVSVQQVIDEVQSLELNESDRKARSLPFAGRLAEDRFVTNPMAIASVYREELQFDDAREYLKSYLETQPAPSPQDKSKQAELSRRRMADVYRLWGQIALDQQNAAEAVLVFEKSLSFFASRSAFAGLGTALNKSGQTSKAIKALERANSIRPTAETFNQLGVLFQDQTDYAAARKAFQDGLRTDTRFLPAANNLAWLMATCPDEKIRNGRQAVRIAEQLAKSTNHQRPDILDTLAAAYAENGNFESAIATAGKAVTIAEKRNLQQLAARIHKRLQLFQKHEPYRISALK